MIYTAILCFDGVVGRLPMPADSAAVGRVEKTENAELRHHRAMAYALLELAYCDIYGAPMPNLAFCDDGKPRLVGSRVKISVSHTGGVCAVSFSDCDVGVDVQSYREAAGKERVLQRFVNDNLQKAIKSTKLPEVSLRFYKALESGELVPAERGEAIRHSGGSAPKTDSLGDVGVDFDIGYAGEAGAPCAALWSALEALLKCRHGFSELSRAAELAAAAQIKTFYLPNAALSVAILAKHKSNTF